MKLKMLVVTLLLLLLTTVVVQSVAAMASPNYKLDWFLPLTGGGGAASSSHFAINYTVGQTVVGHSSSAHFTTGLGFWAGIWSWFMRLPLLFK